MCNLYSLTKGQSAMAQIARAMRDKTGNLPPMPSIYPDTLAPVVYAAPEDGVRELGLMRWGFPPPPNVGKAPVTNIRNTASPFWRPWLKTDHRCLVPVTSFCEYADTKPRKTPYWFTTHSEEPLFFFAGLWRPWSGTRGKKANPASGDHRLFAFLTCEANDLVRPIHPRAMPVILNTLEACEQWLNAPVQEALDLQRPAKAEVLQITQPPAEGSAPLGMTRNTGLLNFMD